MILPIIILVAFVIYTIYIIFYRAIQVAVLLESENRIVDLDNSYKAINKANLDVMSTYNNYILTYRHYNNLYTNITKTIKYKNPIRDVNVMKQENLSIPNATRNTKSFSFFLMVNDDQEDLEFSRSNFKIGRLYPSLLFYIPIIIVVLLASILFFLKDNLSYWMLIYSGIALLTSVILSIPILIKSMPIRRTQKDYKLFLNNNARLIENTKYLYIQLKKFNECNVYDEEKKSNLNRLLELVETVCMIEKEYKTLVDKHKRAFEKFEQAMKFEDYWRY